MSPDLTPRSWLTRALGRWPLLIAGAAAGAVLGLAFSWIRPPRFQAEAVLAVGIDYGRTKSLTLLSEDRALDRVWQLLTSDAVLQEVVDDLADRAGPDPAWEDLFRLRGSLRLEQRLSDWHLLATHSDPAVAAMMADRWAEIGLAALARARGHAFEAQRLQGGYLDVRCLPRERPQTLEGLIQCLASGPAPEGDRLRALIEEIDASYGIIPNLTFELVRQASVPEAPVVYGRGLLVFSGSLLGLVAAALLVGGWRRRTSTRPDPAE